MSSKEVYTNNRGAFNLILILLAIAAFLVGMNIAKGKSPLGDGKVQVAKIATPTAGVAAQAPPPFEPKKSDKPEVKFFVMSYCPYGNQAEAGLEPVYQLLKGKVDLLPRYIVNDKKSSCEQGCSNKVASEQSKAQCQQAIDAKQVTGDVAGCLAKYFPYKTADDCLTKECATIKPGAMASLHGDQELNQNAREICAFNMGDLDKWWKFIGLMNTNCTAQNADTCWEKEAKTAGLDTAKIKACETTQARTLFAKEIDETTKYQVSGSPTVLVNGTVFNGGRSAEDYKVAICSAFTNPPAECSQTLGQTTAPSAGGCN